MPTTASCRCDERGYLHAHCHCSIYNCNGKAVSRSTYQNHRKAAQEVEISRNEDLHATAFIATNESEPVLTGVINPDSGIICLSMHD